jgi:hypothetical protein
MTSSLNALAAAEHAAGLRRAARDYRSGKTETTSSPDLIALRRAGADDAPALKILAELDEQPELSGEALIALVDAEVVAAISLNDGRTVSNPFVASSDAVSLLRLRADQLLGRDVPRGRRPWRLRLA